MSVRWRMWDRTETIAVRNNRILIAELKIAHEKRLIKIERRDVDIKLLRDVAGKNVDIDGAESLLENTATDLNALSFANET